MDLISGSGIARLAAESFKFEDRNDVFKGRAGGVSLHIPKVHLLIGSRFEIPDEVIDGQPDLRVREAPTLFKGDIDALVADRACGLFDLARIDYLLAG